MTKESPKKKNALIDHPKKLGTGRAEKQKRRRRQKKKWNLGGRTVRRGKTPRESEFEPTQQKKKKERS